MANVKISQLPAADPLDGSEQVPLVQDGVTRQAPSSYFSSAAEPGGSDTQVQYNNAGAFAGDSRFVWRSDIGQLHLGTDGASGGYLGGALAATGADLTVAGGFATAGAGGDLLLRSGVASAGSNAGSVNIAGAASSGSGNAGPLLLTGGQASGTSAAGNVAISGGANTGTGLAGNLTLNGGISASGTPGSLLLRTNNSTRITINPNGAWLMAGTTAGTSGQVMASNGPSSAPTWQSIAGVSLLAPVTPVAFTGDVTGTLIDLSVVNTAQSGEVLYLVAHGTFDENDGGGVGLIVGVTLNGQSVIGAVDTVDILNSGAGIWTLALTAVANGGTYSVGGNFTVNNASQTSIPEAAFIANASVAFANPTTVTLAFDWDGVAGNNIAVRSGFLQRMR